MKGKQTTQTKRGGNYKLVFKPVEYTGKLKNWNNDWENGPLVTWKNNTLSRCYYLVNCRLNVAWASIYRMDKAEVPVAIYKTQRGWNNDVNQAQHEQEAA